MLAGLSFVLALASSGAADNSPPSALEQRACEQQFRVFAKSMGSSEKQSAKDLGECAGAFRQARAASGMDEGQYGRWLQCIAGSATTSGGPCDKMLMEAFARKAGGFLDEDKAQERAALAALALFRTKGLVSDATLKEIEGASRDGRHMSLTDTLEDALQMLREGRVRAGTDLAVYPRLAITSKGDPPPEKGERAANLAFVDARSGKRVVRFSRLTAGMLFYRVRNGEIANALTWVGQKPDARSIEVPFEATEYFRAYDLLGKESMKDLETTGKRLSPALKRIPFLVQGKTSISYERWVALAAAFRARGLDKASAFSGELDGIQTLADLEKVLGR